MSQTTTNLKQIEALDPNQLADALEMNGYAKCVGVIRTKHIDGQTFLKLTELQLSLWRLPHIEARRLWSFMQQIKGDPTQFLMKSQISNKAVPEENSTVYDNLPNKSNILSNKPSVGEKPNRFLKPVQTSETKEANSPILIKQASKVHTNKIEVQKPEQTIETKNTSSSTLTKEESKFLRNKLEIFFKKDPNEAPNSSFIHNLKQPLLPPKPDHFKVTAPKPDEPTDDFYSDGYLAPLNKPNNESQVPESVKRSSETISRNGSTRGSFLHRQRKNYDNLEIRPEVIENKYEEQTLKHPAVVQRRPLPPVPLVPKKANVPVIPLDSDDEDLAEYVSVPDHEEPDIRKEKKENGRRPLPPVPLGQVTKFNQLSAIQRHQLNNAEDDEELAEYTSVIEDDEAESKATVSHRMIKTSRSPLPPLHIPAPPTARSKVKERAKLPTPEDEQKLSPTMRHISLHKPKANEDMFKSSMSTASATLPKGSSTNLKPAAELSFSATLPKPPTNLPKPPIGLPTSSNFLDNTQKEQTDFNFRAKNQFPPPPVLKAESASVDMNAIEDEESFYTEIDLAREPSYRETDRKGARRLLTGLENGAFVIRPSRQSQYICTISIMHSTRMFNLGVERNSEGAIAFGSVAPDFDQPKFFSFAEIITYYSLHPLYLSGESIYLRDVLPRHKY